jgi:hypothetical protein
VWPAGEVAVVEIQVIGFGQRIKVGGVELENVHGVEGAKRGHFLKAIMVPLDRVLAHLCAEAACARLNVLYI